MHNYTLFKGFYYGTNYHGSQRQPGLRTIEGEILQALHSKGYINDTQFGKQEIHSAGRTDAGVHARGMTYGIFNQRDKFYPIEVNTVLPDDIIIWSSGITSLYECIPTIHPRYQAIQRHYKYFYVDAQQQLDSSIVHQVISKMSGTHDFRNFSKYEENTNTVRTVDDIIAQKIGIIWIFDFKARSFLWHQIRKMVRTILLIGSNEWPLDTIDSLFGVHNPDFASKIEPVPPEGLILWNITYPKEMEFQNCSKSILRIQEQLDLWTEGLNQKQSMFREIRGSFQQTDLC
jgi:tRNA pseudouridine38-40 synthase